MAITIRGSLDGNNIAVSPETLANGNGIIEIRGAGSDVSIGEECVFTGTLHIISGPRSKISIGARTRVGHLFLFSEHDAVIAIGTDAIFNGSCRVMAHEPASITIGDGCLFASEINIMASDMHSILDVSTGIRINPAADIYIGDRVWVGDRAAILKGARVEDDSIVSYAAVVTRQFSKNSIIGGVPARIIKSGVCWRHRLI